MIGVVLYILASAALFTACDTLSRALADPTRRTLSRRGLWIRAGVILFTLCDTFSRILGEGGEQWPLAMGAICLTAPLAFFCLGTVTQAAGLALGSAIINASNIVSSMIIGIILFAEWATMSLWQWLGIASALLGLWLMLFGDSADPEEEVESELRGRSVRRLAMLFLPPLAYVFFGQVTANIGLAIGSAVINCTNLLGSVLVGLVAMQEWRRVSARQYTGMLAASAGIVLMLFF